MRKTYGKIANENLRKQMKRKLTIRKKINGTSDIPRICVIRSNKHVQVKIVDDVLNKTLFSVQTFGKNKVGSKNKEGIKDLGLALSKKLKDKAIERAVFDRNGRRYMGVLAELGKTLRENSIKI